MKRKVLILFVCILSIKTAHSVIIASKEESYEALEAMFIQSGLPLLRSMPANDMEMTGRCFRNGISQMLINTLRITERNEVNTTEIVYKRGPLFGEEDMEESITFTGLGFSVYSHVNDSYRQSPLFVDKKTGRYVLQDSARETFEDVLNDQDILLEILGKNAFLILDRQEDKRIADLDLDTHINKTQISLFKWIRDGGTNYLLEKRLKIKQEVEKDNTLINSEDLTYYCVYWPVTN